VRDWLHVDDHARALWTLVQRGPPGEKYNIGGRSELSNLAVAERICAVLDRRRPQDASHAQLIAFVADRPGHTASCDVYAILRTSWIYSPFGHNFVKTMLRLGETKPEIGVVSDQIGNPTYALHLADAILKVAHRLTSAPEPRRLAGIYNAAGRGDASWFDLAEEVFRCSRALGGPSARVRAITTADYKTPAPRPASSRLDCTKLERVLGIALPSWTEGTRDCVARLVRPAAGTLEGSDG
jgi:dTDP-4-dehydrorhamnose reductase